MQNPINKIKYILFIFIFIFISACGGGGGNDNDKSNILAFVTKGPVTDAKCHLKNLADSILATATSDKGRLLFPSLPFDYIECSGGTYTDEVTSKQKDSPLMRGFGTVVTPLTEIIYQIASIDNNESNTDITKMIAKQFGLGGVDITSVKPTDLNITQVNNDAAGKYGTILAAFAKMGGNNIAKLIKDLTEDLKDKVYDDRDSLLVALDDLGNANIYKNDNVITDIKNDINGINNPPNITKQTFRINENIDIDTQVGTIVATDVDLNPVFKSWSIVSGNTENAFAINSDTGIITVIKALDYENIQTYTLGITVSDGINTSEPKNISIIINDINDNPPNIITTQTFEINENIDIDTQVGTIVATDVDLNPVFSWSIVSGNTENAFAINSDTGIITVFKALDYENIQTYTLGIKVSDGIHISEPKNISIIINDINDNPPNIITTQTFRINENIDINTQVGTIVATDVDLNPVFSWSIVSGNTENAFAINSNTGIITVIKALDYENIQTYTLGIKVSDGINTSAVKAITIVIIDFQPTLSMSVTYDRVPPNSDNVGLDYDKTMKLPVRKASLEIIRDSDNVVLATATLSVKGTYSITLTDGENVRILVKAELLKTGTPSWDFKIVDNTNDKSLYTMQSSVITVDKNIDVILHAASGWNGSSYANDRVAAPFAILDTIYSIIDKDTIANNNLNFPATKFNWSVDNVATAGDPEIGQIGTSYYSTRDNELYVLGSADSDTDEYDYHIIIHEWGHYFEESFSRSDSIGGHHSIESKLDMRVAFGEGFANAFSGIITDNPIYFDTIGLKQAEGMSVDVSKPPAINPGWWNEGSVQYILYDLYASAISKTDSFNKILSVMLNGQKNTPAFTSIFSFIHNFKINNVDDIKNIDELVSTQNINIIKDAYGTGETHDGGTDKNLPVYHTITAENTINVCVINDNGSRNKLGISRYIRFIATKKSHTITLTITEHEGLDPDPDIAVYITNPFGIIGYSDGEGAEEIGTYDRYIPNQEYIYEIYDYNNRAGLGGKSACFDVKIE